MASNCLYATGASQVSPLFYCKVLPSLQRPASWPPTVSMQLGHLRSVHCSTVKYSLPCSGKHLGRQLSLCNWGISGQSTILKVLPTWQQSTLWPPTVSMQLGHLWSVHNSKGTSYLAAVNIMAANARANYADLDPDPNFHVVLVLEEELPMAPLGPLRECRCPCAPQPSSCTRVSLHLGWSCHCCSVSSVVALENAHCSSIFYMVWYLIPAFHYSVRENNYRLAGEVGLT